jgi:Flp pilus assembly pilin Flp
MVDRAKGAPNRTLRKNSSGEVSVEYGLIVALIFLAIVVSVTAVASKTSAMFTHIATTVSAAA